MIKNYLVDRHFSLLDPFIYLAAAVLFLVASSSALAADIAWVTDELRLGMYKDQGGRGKPQRTLASDVELRVIERKNQWARVRTTKGVTGWVKAGYLVDAPPAKIALPGLKKELERLRGALSQSQLSLEETQNKRDQLSISQQELENEKSKNLAQLGRLTEENQEIKGLLSARGIQIPLTWSLGASGFALVLGLIAGVAWLDNRIRNRHGGFRIY